MATPEQMQQFATAVTELTTRLEQQAKALNTVQAQNVQLANRLQSRESEIEELRGTLRRQGPQPSSSQEDGHRDSIVQKWAPDMFTGERTTWQAWALKFRSYTGAMNSGEVGRWITKVEENRNEKAVVGTLGEASRATATLLSQR